MERTYKEWVALWGIGLIGGLGGVIMKNCVETWWRCWDKYGPIVSPVIMVLLAIGLPFCPTFDAWQLGTLLNGSKENAVTLTLLGLVVALASYIGSVERDIIKKIADHVREKKENKAKARKIDLRWLIGLDVLLVILSIIILIELILPTSSLVDFAKNIKTVLFPLIILYLAWLHFRQWILQCQKSETAKALDNGSGIVEQLNKTSVACQTVTTEMTATATALTNAAKAIGIAIATIKSIK